MSTAGEWMEYSASIYNEILVSNITIWMNLKHAKGWKPCSNGHNLIVSLLGYSEKDKL